MLVVEDEPTVRSLAESILEDIADGVELARSAVELRPGLRVLYTTGGARTDGMTALFIEGAGFLQKPYTRERLIETLETLLPTDQGPS